MPSRPDAEGTIREKLAAGILPHDARGITFTSFGTGRACDGCDTPILPTEMEYEVQASDQGTIRFHVTCVLLWQRLAQRGAEP